MRRNDFSVRSDYSLLRRLLQNLISNAIKYTEQGAVTIDARVKRNTLVMEVSDTGIGMNKADLEAIFQEFHRLEQGKQAAPGLGLGLSIVRRLASTLEHEMDVETEPGKGSTFKISLPLAIAKTENTSPERDTKSSGFDVSSLVIICIDNDESILDGMNTLLSRWGCTLHLFSDHKSLMEKVGDIYPDVILADYHLDNQNGLEVIGAVRAVVDHDLPATLITADRSAAVRSAARSLDITVLNKPLKPAALRAFLTQLVNQSGSRTAAE